MQSVHYTFGEHNVQQGAVLCWLLGRKAFVEHVSLKCFKGSVVPMRREIREDCWVE